jgi:DNA-binding NtrC family response regulator
LREDLLYRLAVFPITLAPLRERGDDVVLLAEHFLNEINARNDTAKVFSSGARQTLREYRWPGNVRELKNAVERAYILCEHELKLQPMNLHAAASDGCGGARGYRWHLRADRIIAGGGGTVADRGDAGALGWQQESRGQDAGMQPENVV